MHGHMVCGEGQLNCLHVDPELSFALVVFLYAKAASFIVHIKYNWCFSGPVIEFLAWL